MRAFIGIGLTALLLAPVGADAAITSPKSPFYKSVRLSEAPAGLSICDTVPKTLVEPLEFDCAVDAGAYFKRVVKDELDGHNMLVDKPDKARFEISQQIRTLHVAPDSLGSRLQSEIVFTMTEIATGKVALQSVEAFDQPVARGVRWSKILGAVGAGVGAAVAGASPQMVGDMARASQFTAPTTRQAKLYMWLDLNDGLKAAYGLAMDDIIPKLREIREAAP